MTKKWDNEDRNRYYGLRIGDTVEYAYLNGNKCTGKVIGYDIGDNNAVYVKRRKGGKPTKCVAEWCKIIKKVEDKDEET